MLTKEAQTSGDVPRKPDDFKLIHGIGPGIEKRLHAAGIMSYAQLSGITAQEINAAVGTLIGMSAERVTGQDWIGQARQLASESKPIEAEIEASAPESRRHYAGFTLELMLDEENNVRRTRATHVQSQEEGIWAGWEPTQLLNFLVSSAGLNVTRPHESATSETPPAEVGKHPPALPVESEPVSPLASIGGELRLPEMAVKMAEGEIPQRLIHSDRPFDILLTLDLSHVIAPEDTPFSYSTRIFAKKLGSGRRQLVGSTEGTLSLTDRASVDVKDIQLPNGTYRIEGFVTLEPPSTVSKPDSSLMAMVEGGLFQVY